MSANTELTYGDRCRFFADRSDDAVFQGTATFIGVVDDGGFCWAVVERDPAGLSDDDPAIGARWVLADCVRAEVSWPSQGDRVRRIDHDDDEAARSGTATAVALLKSQSNGMEVVVELDAGTPRRRTSWPVQNTVVVRRAVTAYFMDERKAIWTTS